MPAEVRAVVVAGRGAPVSLASARVPDPGPGEAVVRVQAWGMCRTDMHYRDPEIVDEFPFLLGHEAAGVVESVHSNVTQPSKGEFVVVSWRASCGHCRACVKGSPWYCLSVHRTRQRLILDDGRPLTPALGIGAFADKILVHAGQCATLDPDRPAQASWPIGCEALARVDVPAGARGGEHGDEHLLDGPPGSLDRTIIAVDLDPMRREWARQVGATHVVDARDEALVDALVAIVAKGAAVVDTAGRPEAWEQAVLGDDPVVVLIGIPAPELAWSGTPSASGALSTAAASWFGDCSPARGFSTLVERYLRGQIPDRLVCEETGLDAVAEALQRMEHGEVPRPLVVL